LRIITRGYGGNIAAVVLRGYVPGELVVFGGVLRIFAALSGSVSNDPALSGGLGVEPSLSGKVSVQP